MAEVFSTDLASNIPVAGGKSYLGGECKRVAPRIGPSGCMEHWKYPDIIIDSKLHRDVNAETDHRYVDVWLILHQAMGIL